MGENEGEIIDICSLKEGELQITVSTNGPNSVCFNPKKRVHLPPIVLSSLVHDP